MAMARAKRSGRVIAVANQKGGTGKSTIAVNVAAAMGERGLRALVVDVDPQADATTMLGIDPDAQAHTLYDVFVGSCELPGAIAPEVVPGVDVAAGTERMGDVELTLADEMMRERYLADALAGHVDDYDIVLIDCPPNLGLLTVNAFCAAREVLVVVSMTDRNAYKGAMALFATREQAAPQERRRGSHRRRAQQRRPPPQHPLVQFNPDHIGAQAIRNIAAELAPPAARRKAA